MNIDTIIEHYKSNQLNAQDAFQILQGENLLAEAFMDVLLSLHEEKAALSSLCPKRDN